MLNILTLPFVYHLISLHIFFLVLLNFLDYIIYCVDVVTGLAFTLIGYAYLIANKLYNKICSVPDLFVKKKEVTMFFKNFKSLNKKLIFTKTESGRKELLKGKIKSLI